MKNVIKTNFLKPINICKIVKNIEFSTKYQQPIVRYPHKTSSHGSGLYRPNGPALAVVDGGCPCPSRSINLLTIDDYLAGRNTDTHQINLHVVNFVF